MSARTEPKTGGPLHYNCGDGTLILKADHIRRRPCIEQKTQQEQLRVMML